MIRCLLAYLVGLPPSEVPAVEVARGDLIEVTPASYGVVSRAFHFWSGEGRGNAAGENLYENFAEATSGVSGGILPTFAGEAQNIEREAEAEEQMDKQTKANIVRAKLKQRMGTGADGSRSAPHGPDGKGSSTPEEGLTEGKSEYKTVPRKSESRGVPTNNSEHSGDLVLCLYAGYGLYCVCVFVEHGVDVVFFLSRQ